MLLHTTFSQVFNTEADAAAFIAKMLKFANDDADGWTYKIDLDPKGSGRAKVAAYDEDGIFVAYL